MIVERSKQVGRRLMMSSTSQAESRRHRPQQATQAESSTAASAADVILLSNRGQILTSTNGFANSGNDSNDDDNDEENIVIDMCDEDEYEDDGDGDDGREQQEFSKDSSATNFQENNNNDGDDNYNFGDEENFYAKQQAQIGGQSQTIVSSGSNNFNVGDLVWFDPNQLGYSIPGKVIDAYPDLQMLTIEGCAQPNELDIGDDLESYNRLLAAADEQLQVYDLSEPFQLTSVRTRRPLTQESGKVDLIQLEEFSRESIIWNLKLRYKQDLIYTNCGAKILISVNPFRQLNNIYDLDQANKYDSFHSTKLRCLEKFELYDDEPPPCDGLVDHSSSSSLYRQLLLSDDKNIEAKQVSLAPTKTKDDNDDVCPEEAHIFAMANKALMRLLTTGRDQSFVLLGESGSGKTEASKLLVQYFASVNKSPTNLMTEQILESMQVLESFGNAKTIHNDNSSRFGKLLELEFSLTNGFIMNAKTIDLNLLDRSRIVGQAEQERNYHVFYELLAGLSASEKEKYGLEMGEKYFYLNQGNCVELASKDDGEDFRSLLASMQVLGFNYEEQDTIFRVLASVLHLGNIYFHRKLLAVRSANLAAPATIAGEPNCTAGVEGVEVGSDTEARWISHLLQIQFESVMRCLTVRTTETSRPLAQDKIVTPLNIDQALDTRDAIARALYNCLFKWLVQRINAMISSGGQQQNTGHDDADGEQIDVDDEPSYGLCRTSESLCEFQPDKLTATGGGSRESSLHRKGGRRRRSARHQGQQRQQRRRPLAAAAISILDSFGFENLRENNFEQLCINYSAELLQYHTGRYLVRLELNEYTKERLRWTSQPASVVVSPSGGELDATQLLATNGQPAANCVLNLLSKKPLGILALLDDECNFPKATDQSFAEKCHHNHTLNENYQRARLLASNIGPTAGGHEFGVRHFQQQTRLVWYQVEGFVEKNRDALRPDILDLLLKSRMSIVVDMLRKLHRSSGASSSSSPLDVVGAAKTLSRTYDGRFVSMKPRATTVAAKFQDSLTNNRVLESINPRLAPIMAAPAAAAAAAHGEQDATTPRPPRILPGHAPATSHLRQSPAPEPWFIMCLKPNRSRTPSLFDVAFVQDQAIAMQLLEIGHIRQRGYPYRLRFDHFLRDYMCLVPARYLKSLSLRKGQVKRGIRDVCKSLLDYATTKTQSASLAETARPRANFQCGLTKLFLAESLHRQLEARRLQVHHEAICLLQRTIRMWLARAKFLAQRRAAIVIQAHLRGQAARRQYWRHYALVVSLQRRWRHLLALRRSRELERRRQARRAQQHRQLQEISQHQNQYQPSRFRQQATQLGNNSAGHYYSAHGLDIPDDLAQLYRLQRDWLPVHDLSQLRQVELRSDQAADSLVNRKQNDLVNEIEMDDSRFGLQQFLRRFYTSETPQFGYSRLAITRPFDWPHLVRRRKMALDRCKQSGAGADPELRNESIASVRQRFASVRSKCIAIYKLLLRYVDSDQSSIELESDSRAASQKLIKFKLLADYVIYLCTEEPLLRNEIHLQLASLSWQNPKEKSCENCWRFMLMCLHCFGPESRILTKHLLRYTIDNCGYETLRSALMNKLAHYLLATNDELSPRKFPPTILEYRASTKGESLAALALSASTYDSYNHDYDREYAVHDGQDDDGLHVRVESYTASEHLARAVLLQTRAELDETNLFGWTVELEPRQASGADDDDLISCRLRGDDKILDHLSEMELQPEFLALVQGPTTGVANGQQPERSDSEQLYLRADQYRDHQDYEAITANHERSRRRLSADESRRTSWASTATAYRQQQQQRVSSDLELSARSSGLSQTSRLNQRYMQPTGSQYAADQYAADQYEAHYEEPALGPRARDEQPNWQQQQQQQHHYYSPSTTLQTSLSQFKRRSMSMQELQDPPTGRLLPVASNHYACSPSFAGGAIECARWQRRSRTPTDQHYLQPRHLSGSLSRNEAGQPAGAPNRRPRRSASSSNFYAQPPPPPGALRPPVPRSTTSGRMRSSEYASPPTCCSDYYAEPQPDFGRPLAAANKMHQNSSRLKQKSTKNSRARRNAAGGESSHYVASSAISDTSEAPSMASHVRAVKVPQTNGDLDQYLDDLFSPMLGGGAAGDDLEPGEMSDARSLAPSLRRGESGSALLRNLCDSSKLSRIIRGRDLSPETKRQDCASDGPRELLSPTFESLLTSLRHGDGGVGAAASGSDDEAESGARQLAEMNLSQLRALNERLESEIMSQAGNSGADIPEPPPQPSFKPALDEAGDECTTVVHSSPLEDLYDRAKTIRVGKVRWPPQRGEQSQPASAVEDEQRHEQQTTVGQVPRGEPVKSTKTHDCQGSVGKLKISSEMKAKLEQLTNSSSSASTDDSPPPPLAESAGSGIVWQAKSSLLASGAGSSGQVNRLAKQRKHLLESQLLGLQVAAEGAGASSRDSFGGSKVMAAKQQLAAAAGVALALLDSGSASNSQASSRRQSAALAALPDCKSEHLQADELGPQSKSAIKQRQAFYKPTAPSDLEADAEFAAISARFASNQPPGAIAEEPPLAAAAPLEPIPPIPAPIKSVAVPNSTAQANEQQAEAAPLGQSVAKTLAQRQQENLRLREPNNSAQGAGEESRDWIASSPDHHQRAPLQRPTGAAGAGKKRPAACSTNRSTENHNKRPRSSVKQQQQQQQQDRSLIRQPERSSVALSYANVDWRLRVRKELFLPSESYDKPAMLRLLCGQLLADVAKPQQLLTRLNNKERAAVRSALKERGLTTGANRNGAKQLDAEAQRSLVKLARSFGLYFTRSYEAQNYALLADEDDELVSRSHHQLLLEDPWIRRRSRRASSVSSGGGADDDDAHSSASSDTRDQSGIEGGGGGGGEREGDPAELVASLLGRLRSADNLGLDWIDLVAVHHSGLRLVVAIPAPPASGSNGAAAAAADATPTQAEQQQPRSFGYKVLETLKYRDMADVVLLGGRALLVSMRNARKSWLLHSNQATQLSELLRRFHSDYNSQLQKAPSAAAGAPQAKQAATGEAKKQQQQQQLREAKKQQVSGLSSEL